MTFLRSCKLYSSEWNVMSGTKDLLPPCLCYGEKPPHTSPNKTSLAFKITRWKNHTSAICTPENGTPNSWRPRAIGGKGWDTELANGWASYKETWSTEQHSKLEAGSSGHTHPFSRLPPLALTGLHLSRKSSPKRNSDVAPWTRIHKPKHNFAIREGKVNHTMYYSMKEKIS